MYVAVLFPILSVEFILHLGHAFSVTAPDFGQMILLPNVLQEIGNVIGDSLPTWLKLLPHHVPFILATGSSPDPLSTTSRIEAQILSTKVLGYRVLNPLSTTFFLLGFPIISGPLGTIYTFGVFVYFFLICFKVNDKCLINSLLFIHLV